MKAQGSSFGGLITLLVSPAHQGVMKAHGSSEELRSNENLPLQPASSSALTTVTLLQPQGQPQLLAHLEHLPGIHEGCPALHKGLLQVCHSSCAGPHMPLGCHTWFHVMCRIPVHGEQLIGSLPAANLGSFCLTST